MKIRIGFVSNSSSSSFVLFGESIKFSDAPKHIIDGKTIVLLVDGWEGFVLVEIKDLEMFSFIKVYEELYPESGSAIRSCYVSYGFEFNRTIDVDFSKLPKEGHATIDGGEVNQFSVHNIKDTMELFDSIEVDWEEAEKKALSYYKKITRKEKLKEIDSK